MQIHKCIVLTGLLSLGLLGVRAAEARKLDKGDAWPQWRGPNRDGTLSGSPKLLDRWQNGGPPLLWRVQTIGSGSDGGAGSPVVANGCVYVYANQGVCQPGKKLITEEVLTEWGYVPGMPEDLTKKMMDALRSDKRRGLKKPEELEAFAKEFVATLDAATSQKFGAVVRNRLVRDPGFFSPEELTRLAELRDKDFATVSEFNAQVEKRAAMHHRYGGCSEALSEQIQKVFTLYDIFICLDAATGKEVWRKQVAAEGLAMPPNWARYGASGTPAVANDRLVVQGSVALYCLSAKDGSEIWKTKTGFSNSSPLVLNGVVFAGAEPRNTDKVEGRIGGALTAYDLGSGKPLFKAKAGGGGWGASVMPCLAGGKSVLLTMGGGLFCIDSSDGAVLAQTNKGEGVDCWATPAISDGIVVSRSESMTRAYRLEPPSLVKLWDSKNRSGDFESASPLIYEGNVYLVDHGTFRCVDLKTGTEKWMAPKEVNPESSTPLVVDGKIIANTGSNHAKTNQTVMLLATPNACEVLGRIDHPAAPCTSPAVAGGRLYVRLIDGIACYNILSN